jgi:ABC-type transporter Mla MlaB component
LPANPNVSVVPVDGIASGNHVCAFIDSAAVHEELITEFVAAGLERHERVVYFADDDSPDRVLAVLCEGGVSTAAPVEQGQLVIVPMEEKRARASPFDPTNRIAGMNAAIDAALEDGFSGLRATGEQWTTRELPLTEVLLQYEVEVGKLCAARSVSGLCQYDTRFCSAPLLDAVSDLHDHVVRNALISENEMLRLVPLCEDPQGNARLRVSGEADLSNCALLLQALEEDPRGAELHLDVSRLRFVDLRGVGALREVAETLRARRGRLILHHAPASLRRILEIVPACLPDVEIAAR